MGILLGVLSSLVATIIWVLIVFLYDPRSRNKINLLLDECEISTRLLLNSIEYTRYLVALSQVDQLLNVYIQIIDNLKLLNFKKKKRKLIKLLIFNIIRVLNVFKNLEIGYHEEEELKARCINFNNKYLYELQTESNHKENFMIISISILKELNNSKTILRAIRQGLYQYTGDKDSQQRIFNNLIEVNSFYVFSKSRYKMGNELLSQKNYQKIIKKL